MSSISEQLLKSIQQAGAAVHAATSKIQTLTERQANVVNQSMASNPFGLENDSLVDEWKLLARVAHELRGMDSRLRGLYESVPAQAANARGQVLVALPVEAKAKPAKARKVSAKAREKVAAPKGKRGRKAKAAESDTAASSAAADPAAITDVVSKPAKAFKIKGNDAKVLAYLESVINAETFTPVRQADVSKGAGIPQGSVARAIMQLLKHNVIVQGSKGEFKKA